MKTEIGEYVVGAYLKLILKCDIVDYNVRPPGGGIEGLGELDVIGLRFKDKTAYLCEVTTHLDGLLYGDADTTITKIKDKHERQKAYAGKYLTDFHSLVFMFWSPYVNRGKKLGGLAEISGLDLIVNSKYKSAIDELQREACRETTDTGNPFFRVLQLLAHLKDFDTKPSKSEFAMRSKTHKM